MSELYPDDQIPTADADTDPRRTIEDSGWWRAHFLVLASTVFGVPITVFLLGLGFEGFVPLVVGMVAVTVVGLVIVGSSLAALFGYYSEAKLLARSDADWQPRWWLYVLATPFLSVFVVAPIYLYQRHRHVGIPWDDF